MTNAGIYEKDSMEQLFTKMGITNHYYKGGGPALAFAWVFIFEETDKEKHTALFRKLIPYLDSNIRCQVPKTEGKGKGKSKGKGKVKATKPTHGIKERAKEAAGLEDFTLRSTTALRTRAHNTKGSLTMELEATAMARGTDTKPLR